MMRNVQMWIQLFLRRNYDLLKLLLLIFIASMAVYFAINSANNTQRETRESIENTERIVKSIQEETAKQTSVISKQFRALCVVIIQTAGEDGIERLDPPLDEQCRGLTEDGDSTDDSPIGVQVLPTEPTAPTPKKTPPKDFLGL